MGGEGLRGRSAGLSEEDLGEDRASLGCAGLGQLHPLEKVPRGGWLGGRAWAKPQAPFLSSSWVSGVERHSGKASLVGLGEEGCPKGFWQEACRNHSHPSLPNCCCF